jgi:hypothetical protein
MTLYFCVVDYSYIAYYSDGSNTQEVIDWTLNHRSHKVVKLESECTSGVAIVV